MTSGRTTASAAAAIAPLDILSARPWTEALFTTYSLSLAFFESYVLRQLDLSRCKVWVVADADGYRTSLMERRSRGAGLEYWLAPIKAPGVFHPKCTYLRSDDGDVLCVGSGNLTFGGFGRNLEVLDVLQPEFAAAAFVDFADFLESLSSRESLRFTHRNWAGRFARHARRAAETTVVKAPTAQPRLLHSVRQPIAEQFASHAQPYGKVSRLTVLSPFFDPKGAAVKKLAETVKSPHVTIGLPVSKGELSTFPFALAGKWGFKIDAVQPDVKTQSRPLHAKWIELICNRAQLYLTGSVNATDAALWSTNNIEVGVLRISKPAERSPAGWKRVAIPQKTRTLKFHAGDTARWIVIDAAITPEGMLRGALLSGADLTGTWKGEIFGRDGTSIKLSVNVSADGTFRCKLPDQDALTKATTLQISLRHDKAAARGWVQNEALLALPPAFNPILRFLAGADSADADSSLIEDLTRTLITRIAPLFLRPFSAVILPASESPASPQSTAGVPIDALRPQGSAEDDAWCEALSGSSRHTLDRLFARMRQRVLGAGPLPEIDTDAPDETEEEDGRAPRKAPASLDHHQTHAALLETLDRRLQPLLEEYEDDESKNDLYSALLVAWLEMKLFLLARLKDRARSIKFLSHWLDRAALAPRPEARDDALRQHFCTSMIFLIIDSQASGDAPLQTARLRELLDTSNYRDIDEQAFIAAVQDDPFLAQSEFLLGADRRDDVPLAVHKLFATQTISAQLAQAINAYHARTPIPANLPIFADKFGQDFYQALTAPSLPSLVRVVPGEQTSCANCYFGFSGDAAIDFKQRRVARCIHCKRYTVRL